MATAVQVQYRRGTSSQVASFTGAAGEMVVDTTNNRVVVQDGATAGGWPMAAASRVAVSDTNYTLSSPFSIVAYTAITAARTVSLPATTNYASGQRLLVIDESGSCSSTKTITLSRNGSDTIDGATSAVINQPYGYIELESNSGGKWTISDQGPQVNALNGLAGQLTLAATDGLAISTSGSNVLIGGPGGMVNKFRNGTMDVWQRGTSISVSTSGAYSADGWIVTPTGAGVTAAQAGGRLLTKNSLQVTGASSVTDVQIAQRIESVIAATFCSQTVTVQAQIYNNSGGSITPTLTVKRPSAQDGWSGTINTDVNAVSLQSCANGAWTQVAYTFSANASSYNGLQITFDFGNNFGANTKTIQITECDIRVTPGATAGQQNNSPPPPELPSIAIELQFCQRYFSTNEFGATNNSTMSTFPGFASASNTIHVANIVLPVTMRAVPTITFFSPNQGTPSNGMFSYYNGSAWTAASATSAVFVSQFTFSASLTVSGATFGEAYIAGGVWTASAEL
jgi:hypothetical protein